MMRFIAISTRTMVILTSIMVAVVNLTAVSIFRSVISSCCGQACLRISAWFLKYLASLLLAPILESIPSKGSHLLIQQGYTFCSSTTTNAGSVAIAIEPPKWSLEICKTLSLMAACLFRPDVDWAPEACSRFLPFFLHQAILVWFVHDWCTNLRRNLVPPQGKTLSAACCKPSYYRITVQIVPFSIRNITYLIIYQQIHRHYTTFLTAIIKW
jgi:hypothetical protein